MVVRIIKFMDRFAGVLARCRRVARFSAVLTAFLPAACGAPDPQAPATIGAASPSSRVITINLWAGHDLVEAGGRPAAPVTIQNGTVTISGPFNLPHPVTGERVLAYERVATTPQGPRRQLLSTTDDGAGLGRLLDERTGLPARRFEGDLIFPLGEWTKGEQRRFSAIEHTALGPARRQITITVPEIDFTFRNVPRSMAYILTIADAAGRILTCERYVYSPGIGLAAFESDRIGPDGDGCNACPCPATVAAGSS